MFIISRDQTNFNPRSLAGATAVLFLILPELTFQSTLPRGSDGIPLSVSHKKQIFQSTLPRGSD